MESRHYATPDARNKVVAKIKPRLLAERQGMGVKPVRKCPELWGRFRIIAAQNESPHEKHE
jgi:hypothetical protein